MMIFLLVKNVSKIRFPWHRNLFLNTHVTTSQILQVTATYSEHKLLFDSDKYDIFLKNCNCELKI